jgi:hypothetical protein
MAKDTTLTRWYTHQIVMRGSILMPYIMIKLRRLAIYM